MLYETFYIGPWHLSPLQSRHLRTSHGSPSCHQLPSHIFLNDIYGLKFLSFQRWFWFWEKSEVSGHQILSVEGLSLTWVIWCFGKKLCRTCEAWADSLLWWSCQSPVVYRCDLLNHANRFWSGMFKLNANFDADSLFYLLSHFECGSHTVHVFSQLGLPFPPPQLVQWSHHCSHMHIAFHSPWLPGYIDVW